MPADKSSPETKKQWLLELCKKHVETYVMRSEVSSLVQQTHELHQANQERFSLPFCRM